MLGSSPNHPSMKDVPQAHRLSENVPGSITDGYGVTSFTDSKLTPSVSVKTFTLPRQSETPFDLHPGGHKDPTSAQDFNLGDYSKPMSLPQHNPTYPTMTNVTPYLGYQESTYQPRPLDTSNYYQSETSPLKKSQLNISGYLENLKQSQIAHSKLTSNPNYNPEKLYFKDPEIQRISNAAKARNNLDWRDPAQQKAYFAKLKETGLFNERYYGLPPTEFDLRLSQIQQGFPVSYEHKGYVPEFKNVSHNLATSGVYNPQDMPLPTAEFHSKYSPRVHETDTSFQNASTISVKSAGNKEIRGVRPSYVNLNDWKSGKDSFLGLDNSRFGDLYLKTESPGKEQLYLQSSPGYNPYASSNLKQSPKTSDSFLYRESPKSHTDSRLKYPFDKLLSPM